MSTGDTRLLCTAEQPMPAGYQGRVSHDGASEVHDSQRDGYPGGDTVKMRCPNCGHTWTEELPQ